jgi:uncharacterized protein HemX
MRNRQTHIQAATIAKVVALSLFLGGSGVGYVFQGGQIDGLAKQIRANDEVLNELETRQRYLKMQLEESTSRARLELARRQFNLPLAQPDRQHVLTLPEPQIDPPRKIQLVNQP